MQGVGERVLIDYSKDKSDGIYYIQLIYSSFIRFQIKLHFWLQ